MIILSSSHSSLKKLLDQNKTGYFYVSIDYIDDSIKKLLEEKRCKYVDIRNGLGGIDFRSEYIDFIGKLNQDHRSIHWWANSISYKGTFVSDLFLEAYYYYCLVSLVNTNKMDLIVISSRSLLNQSIKQYLARQGIECKFLDEKRESNKISHFMRCVLSNFLSMSRGFLFKSIISLELSGKIKKVLKRNTPYYVIRSWIDKRSFSENGAYIDSYFGSLLGYLKEEKKDFIVLVGSLTNSNKIIKKLKAEKDILIVPQEYFIGYLDFLKVAFLTFFNRPKLKNKILFRDIDLTELVNRCLDKDYENGEVYNNFLYYYYMKGLLKKVEARNFIYVFENRAWERISILAIKEYSPLTKTIGYVHSSIRQSYLGYFQSNIEKDIVPSPDKILTVGGVAVSMLSRLGNFSDKIELKEGCALRYEHFYENNAKRIKGGNVVVAFPVDIGCTLKVYKFLNDIFSTTYKHRIILRPHPFTPLEGLIKAHSLELNNNFEISKYAMLEQDLKDVNVLIYTDSTAGMEALMLGIPVIHIDFKELLNKDPLFELNSLKWTVSRADELKNAIDHIYNMENEEYLIKYNEAVVYLKNYFHPVEEKYLKEFIS